MSKKKQKTVSIVDLPAGKFPKGDFRGPIRNARQFLLSRGWRKAIAMDPMDTEFLAGLVRLMLAGSSLKAEHDVLIARPAPSLDDPDGKQLRREMKRLGKRWSWSKKEEGFVSFYPGG